MFTTVARDSALIWAFLRSETKKTKLCHAYYYNEKPVPYYRLCRVPKKTINLCPSPTTTTPILVVIFSFFSTLTILFLLNALLEIHTPRRWCPSPIFNPVYYYHARPKTILEEKQRNLVRCSVTIIKRKYPFLLPWLIISLLF